MTMLSYCRRITVVSARKQADKQETFQKANPGSKGPEGKEKKKKNRLSIRTCGYLHDVDTRYTINPRFVKFINVDVGYRLRFIFPC